MSSENSSPNNENRVSYPANQTSDSQSIGNQKLNSRNPTSAPEISMSNSGNSMINTASTVDLGNEATQSAPTNLKSDNQIAGSISKEKNEKEDYTNIKYGKDASVVITENGMKTINSVGKYSSSTEVTPSSTEFGTVIGGVNGQSKFGVIKPDNSSENENSNLRSTLQKHDLKESSITST